MPSSVQLPGMSESLAEGLVGRFLNEWKDSRERRAKATKLKPTAKRAAAFRNGRRYLEESVPHDLKIMSISTGDRSGMDKKAQYALLHWVPEPTQSWLAARMDVVCGTGEWNSGNVTALSYHALVRLFQRLKATDEKVVLAEASHAVLNVYRWHSFHKNILGLAEILVPTPNGAAVFGRDDTDASWWLFMKTWMSATRMRESEKRTEAVEAARAEEGFVLMANDSFVVISRQRLAGKWSPQHVFDYIRSQTGGGRNGNGRDVNKQRSWIQE